MALIGYGCDLQISTNGGSSYSSLGEIEEFDMPDIKATDVRVSNIEMGTPWHQWMPGLLDAETIKFKLIFRKATYNTLATQFATRSNYLFRIVFSDLNVTASTYVNNGYFNAMGGVAPLDDKIMVNGQIRQNGIPTFTAGT